jgi:membrane-associated protein
MEWLQEALRFVLNLDDHLGGVIRQHGPWFYGIVFAIIFCETGLVVTPFLPGDSLLFATGVLAAQPDYNLNVWVMFGIIVSAALLGDNVNYWLGRTIGRKLHDRPDSKIFKKAYLDKTHAFLEHHGPKAIIIARFTPIVRTFMPFVAGMGEMSYGKFLRWSVIAALIWVVVCLLGGYFFGNIPIVRDNFSYVALILIAATLIPLVWEFMKYRKTLKQAEKEG